MEKESWLEVKSDNEKDEKTSSMQTEEYMTHPSSFKEGDTPNFIQMSLCWSVFTTSCKLFYRTG